VKRSFKRSLFLLLLACAMAAGFLEGRALNTGASRRPGSHSLSRILSLNAGLGENGAPAATDGTSDVPPAEVFESVLDHVQHEFVENGNHLSDARLTDGALARMLASLEDPKTNYLEPELRQARQDELQGHFHGIGAALTVVKTHKLDVDYNYLTVVAVMPNSPAEKAGLKTGDHITEVNGHWVIAYPVLADYDRILREVKDEGKRRDAEDEADKKHSRGYSVVRALSALSIGEGKTVQLTLERAGQAAPQKLALTTARTEVAPVTFRQLPHRIGYLGVRQFNMRAATDIKAALSQLGADSRGLILDLRSNPGGVRTAAKADADGYNAALSLLGAFTRRGTTLAQIERTPNHREPLKLNENGSPLSLPLVVLVDQGTANLGEMVAAALRDTAHAKVIGTPTFGDDTLLFFAVLKSGGGIEMSSAHLYTASGMDLSRGVQPDMLANPGNDPAVDAALQRALRALGA